MLAENSPLKRFHPKAKTETIAYIPVSEWLSDSDIWRLRKGSAPFASSSLTAPSVGSITDTLTQVTTMSPTGLSRPLYVF